MVRKLMSVLALLCGVEYANATVQYMTVEQQSGEKYSFLLKDNPVVTYEGSDLVVNGNASTSYAISGVKNYHFTEFDETDVEILTADMLRIVCIDEATIEVCNAEANANVVLVGANGMVQSSTMVSVSGKVRMNLPKQSGVYVLRVGTKSFKIIRK